MTFSADDVNEVQTIQTVVDITGDYKLSVVSDVQPKLDEVQTIMTSVKRLKQKQSWQIGAFLDGSTSAYTDSEIVSIVAVSNDLSTNQGSFDIQYNGLTSPAFAVGTVSSSVIIQLFNDDLGATISGVTVADDAATDTRTWTVTFAGSEGNVGVVTLGNPTNLQSTPTVYVDHEGSKQEIQKITTLNTDTGIVGEGWQVSVDGGATWSAVLSHDASETDVEREIESILGGGLSVDVVKNTNSASDIDYTVTFLNYVGDVPDLSFQNSFTGGSVFKSDIVTGDSYTVTGNFRLGYDSLYSSNFDISTATSSSIEADILANFPAITDVSVDFDTSHPTYKFLAVSVLDPAVPSHMFTIDDLSLQATRKGIVSVMTQQANVLGGSFTLSTGVPGTTSFAETAPLDHDVSASVMASAVAGLNSTWTGLTVTKTPIDTDYNTNIFAINFPPGSGDVDVLQLTSSLTGFEQHAIITETVKGSEVEIQKILVTGGSNLDGNYSLSFGGYKTVKLDWNAGAGDVRDALMDLPSIGTVAVDRTLINVTRTNGWFNSDMDDDVVVNTIMPIDNFKTYEYRVTFTSHVGDVDMITACCDETTQQFNSAGKKKDITLLALHSEDSEIVITEERKGTGEKLFGHFFVTVEGQGYAHHPTAITTSPIPVTATASEVEAAISSLPIFSDPTNDNTVQVSKTFSAIENGAATFDITLSGLQSAANYSSSSEAFRKVNVTVSTDHVSGTAASLTHNVESQFTRKEVQKIDGSAVPASGSITCTYNGGNSFAFAATSSPSVVEAQIQGVLDSTSNLPVFGDVVVSRSLTAPYSWTVTFAELAEVTADLVCDNGAIVSNMHDGNGKKITTGTFKLMYGGFATSALNHNSNAAAVQSALESLASIGVGNVAVSDNDGGNTDLNGGRSWDVTFTGSTVEGDVPAISYSSVTLDGTNSYIKTTEKVKGNELSGSFRVKFPVMDSDYNDAIWSPVIPLSISPLLLKPLLQTEMPNVIEDIAIEKNAFDAQGGFTFTFKFSHYVGTPPFGHLPPTARNIAPRLPQALSRQ